MSTSAGVAPCWCHAISLVSQVYPYRCSERMKLLPELVLLAVLLSQQVSTTEGFQIAAFNIQQLGLEKIRTARFATALANVRMYKLRCAVLMVQVFGTKV